MAIQPNYRFLAEKLRGVVERLRGDSDETLGDLDTRRKRADEIEWCIQGLDGYCS
jgi:hypothetical protein